MIKTLEQIIYESPQLDSIEVEVEKGFAASDGYDPDGTGRDPVEG